MLKLRLGSDYLDVRDGGRDAVGSLTPRFVYATTEAPSPTVQVDRWGGEPRVGETESRFSIHITPDSLLFRPER